MGTNYYTKSDVCEHCGRGDKDFHLGKSSMGWQFSFQYNGGEHYKNVEEMKEWLRDKEIYDEYDRPVTHEDFWAMVDMKQMNPDNKNHYEECKAAYGGREHILLVDGYTFINCKFS